MVKCGQGPGVQKSEIIADVIFGCSPKTVHANKNLPLPLKVFEISDVVFRDPSKDVGARQVRVVGRGVPSVQKSHSKYLGLIGGPLTIHGAPSAQRLGSG